MSIGLQQKDRVSSGYRTSPPPPSSLSPTEVIRDSEGTRKNVKRERRVDRRAASFLSAQIPSRATRGTDQVFTRLCARCGMDAAAIAGGDGSHWLRVVCGLDRPTRCLAGRSRASSPANTHRE